MKAKDLKLALSRVPDDFDIVLRDEDEGYTTLTNQFIFVHELCILVPDEYYHTYESLIQEIK